MMTTRTWSLCSDLDGVGTAMITSRVMSVPSSAHPRRVANSSRSPRQADFADPLVLGVPGCLDICPGVLLARAPLADPSPDHGRGHNDAGRSQRRLRDGGATTLSRVTAPTLSTRLRPVSY